MVANTPPLACLGVVICVFTLGQTATGQWQPAEQPLMTRWAKDVSPDKVHPEYPRPQMTRAAWQNLNGLWQYAVVPRGEDRPEVFQGDILVPFPIESALSGVKRFVGQDNRLWYRRTFDVPEEWHGQRVLLHFGAVDWETTVWVNGTEVGSHRGGYDPFSFDITDALKPDGPQEVVLAVWDPTDGGWQPRGKQVNRPQGIWYTAVTGIWQTVWLEPVPAASLRSLKIVPNVDQSTVTIRANVVGAAKASDLSVKVVALDGEDVAALAVGPADNPLVLRLVQPKLWSPNRPFLYQLKVSLISANEQIDEVDSYFGMRKIALGKDHNGVVRMMLNNEPVFQYGFLDQGWWPDGLYTAPTDEALRYDLEMTKRIGMNLVRKHVKVEPARWYYHCDVLGLLVWQDMPNGDRHIGGNDPDLVRSKESTDNFRTELKAMIDAAHNSPAIVMWVPFNEGWGQFDTEKITSWIKQYDPNRLVNSASGWTDRGTGDVNDVHKYIGPAMPPLELKRAAVLGEFGGLGLPLDGHTWQIDKKWGYQTLQTREQLAEGYRKLMVDLRPLVEKGLSAAVYTQTTDVEGEVNGLMTYDREILKIDEADLRRLHEPLHAPLP